METRQRSFAVDAFFLGQFQKVCLIAATDGAWIWWSLDGRDALINSGGLAMHNKDSHEPDYRTGDH